MTLKGNVAVNFHGPHHPHGQEDRELWDSGNSHASLHLNRTVLHSTLHTYPSFKTTELRLSDIVCLVPNFPPASLSPGLLQ